jgi:FtsZ-interacting cell division protein ZipA
MSDLQIVLIVLGGFIIAGVVVYNWLQERKLRENITDEFIVPQKDVLVEEFYIDADALVDKEFADGAHKTELVNKLNENSDLESTPLEETLSPLSSQQAHGEELEAKVETKSAASTVASSNVDLSETSEAVEGAPKVQSVANDTHEPDIIVEKNILPAEFEPLVTTSLPSGVHSQIDLTAFLYATKNINGHALNTMMKNLLKDIGVLFMQHGLDQDDVWHLIDDSTKEADVFKQIACSLQLADRRGPVPKAVLNKFQFAIETIGLEFSAHVEWQGKGDPAQRAIDLDKFSMDVDQLVSVHLMQGDTPIHGTKFKGLAEANDMKLKHGKFCYFDNVTPDYAQFVLVNADEQPFTADGLRQNIVRGATFQIEIPKVLNCDQVFTQMITAAQKMANSLGARMVDDNQKPLGDLQIEKIRQQLKVIHATMVARGVMPGSASSMRLFN